MTVVEMMGMVGSGKTTLAGVMSDDLEGKGFQVLPVTEALHVVLSRTAVGSVVRALVSSEAGRERVHGVLYRRVIRPCYCWIFIARHPRLAALALAAVGRSAIGVRHRVRILKLFVRPGAAQLFLGPRMEVNEILLFEEGLVHRAVNLFSWCEGEVDVAALEQYVDRVPATDLIVVVEASTAVAVDRARARGLPVRLIGVDDATIERFMARAAEVAVFVAGALRRSDRPTVVIDNDGPVADAIASLRASLADHLAEWDQR